MHANLFWIVTELPSLEDVNGEKLFKLAKDLYAQGDYIKVLEVIEDLSFVKGVDKGFVDFLQGLILIELASKTENADVKFTYLLGSVEFFSTSLPALAAISLFDLAKHLESVLYYKLSLGKAKQALVDSSPFFDALKNIIETAESRIAESKNGTDFVKKPRNCEQVVKESDQNYKRTKPESDFVKGLRSYWWAGLNVEKRRNFMKVSIADFASYVQRIYGTEGRDALEKAFASSRKEKKWRLWICRSCSKEFSSAEKCMNHLEEEHGAGYQHRVKVDRAVWLTEAWGRMISDGGWEPVDTVAAVEMIKNQLEHVKAFAYENGWSKDWPLAADEERGMLLQQIRLLLLSFWERNILSSWVMGFVGIQLQKLVSIHSLLTCRLVKTPQSICFLQCHELNQVLDLLKLIKCEKNDGTDVVCRAVDNIYSGSRVKEKIDFDMKFSSLLLDKRLLQCKISEFDDEGTISLLNPNGHYAKAHARGDDILSWLADPSSGDEKFRFPRSIRAHNLDIWVSVLRSVQYTCRTLRTKYEKKLRLESFQRVYIHAKNLCMHEDERRRNTPGYRWNTYAFLLCDECEKKHLTSDPRDSLATELYFSAVQDVLKGVSHPAYGITGLEDCLNQLNVIRDYKIVGDDVVLKSIDHLLSAVGKKLALLDSKILLIDDSRINLLNYLTRLCVFDYRSYILGPLKEFLLEGIVDMVSKAKLAAAKADLLLEEEMKSQSKKNKNKSNKEEFAAAQPEHLTKKKQEKEKNSMSKKKKRKNKKVAEDRNSTNTSGILDQNVEQTAEKDSMEHDSSKSDNQEEAAKGDLDMQNIPREDSLSKHLEPANGEGPSRYNSGLDMTLKALCNIKVLKEYLVQNRNQFHDNLEERVPCALGNFFTAFASKQMKEEGLYSCLLSDLLASLEEVNSMSSNAAELLVSILEFWPCWRSSEIESVVTRLFTLGEYERMSCSKCRKKPNYPEQSSYGIVMAADSIRDLKYAFGNMTFEDILKVIRMEDKMLCDIKTGGCGKANFLHHIISTCPPIFTIVLEWEKDETEKEISETTMALKWEIDMSRLYEGLEPNTKYRLVSMVGYNEEEEEHICLAYKKNRWVSFMHGASAKEVVGNWNSMVRFCGEKKVRLEILFYEAFQWPNK